MGLPDQLLPLFRGQLPFESINFRSEPDYLHPVDKVCVLLGRHPPFFVHNPQGDNQLADVMQPDAEQQFLPPVAHEALRLPPRPGQAVEIVEDPFAVGHHMSRVAAVVGGALVDGGRHHPHEGLKQVLDLLDVPHVLDGDGRLRPDRFQHQGVVRRKGADVTLPVQRVEKLDDPQLLALPVAQRHHQHGLGVVAGDRVVPGRP